MLTYKNKFVSNSTTIHSSEKSLNSKIGNQSSLNLLNHDHSCSPVIQCYLYTGASGHAPQGQQRHHIMPSTVLEHGIAAYYQSPDGQTPYAPEQDDLEEQVAEDFEYDVIDLPTNIHSAPHLVYNQSVTTYLGGVQGVYNLIRDIANDSNNAAITEDDVLEHFGNIVINDRTHNTSINH